MSALVLEGDPHNSGREATPAERGDVFGVSIHHRIIELLAIAVESSVSLRPLHSDYSKITIPVDHFCHCQMLCILCGALSFTTQESSNASQHLIFILRLF